MALWDECRDRFDRIDVQQWARQDRDDIFAPAYFQQFAHYPSALITPETQLALLAKNDSIDFTQATTNANLPPEMRPVFHPAILQGLLSRLRDWPISFGALLEDTSRETGQPQDLCARQVLWLTKYGMVKPLEPKPNSHSVIVDEAQAKKKARLQKSMVE